MERTRNYKIGWFSFPPPPLIASFLLVRARVSGKASAEQPITFFDTLLDRWQSKQYEDSAIS
jgi:hypothetical protein